VIAGRGSYLPDLQVHLDVEGVNDLVHLAGFVADDDLRTLLHTAGCVVIPSLYEPFGIVALEAMAAGAPTVAARTGGLAEILADTDAGLLFEPGDPNDLADQLEAVLTNPAVAQSLQGNAATLVAERYSWDAIAVSTVDVYRQALRPG
jgi:glycosyltransferase involved in cell wall biosynthesis